MKENCITVKEDCIIVKENCIDLTSDLESTILPTPSLVPSISNNVQSTSKPNLRK